jgi:methionine-rich copper-binding protein CopC
MISRRLRIMAASILALSTLLGMNAGLVSAHAQYSGSTPGANSTVSAVPNPLQVVFTQELSDIQISVKGPGGAQVNTAPAKFDLEQRHNASVPTQDAGPGLYTVVWHNVSGEDGDSNDGSFVFTVAGAAPSTATTPLPVAAAPASPVPAPAPAPAVTSGQATTPTQAATVATAATCIDNGVRTKGIADVRIDTYCKRQAIRDKYAGQIDVAGFNDDIAAGKGYESALADAMADFQAEQAQKKH